MILTSDIRGQRLNTRTVLYRFHWGFKKVHAWVTAGKIMVVVGEDKHYTMPSRPKCNMDTFEWIVHCITTDKATEVPADQFVPMLGDL